MIYKIKKQIEKELIKRSTEYNIPADFLWQSAVLTHHLQLSNCIKKISYPYEKEAEKILKLWAKCLGYEKENGSLVLKEELLDYIQLKPFFNNKHRFTFIDLFSGIGGFRISMQSLGGKCVFSSEWDSHAQETYYENYGEVPFGDITKEEIKKEIPKQFDILCAGFPCQPFSYAGEKLGFLDETRGTLFFDICKILEKHNPPIIFLENVKGLISHNNGETLKIIENKLTELGYFIHWKILSSLDFGLPQKRERWYCVGFKKNIPFDFPNKIGGNPTLRDIIDLNEHSQELSIPQFELDRIDFHFANAKSGERVQHDNSKYAPNTKKGRYGVFSFQKPDGSLRFHVGDVAKTQIQEAFYACLDTYAPTIIANRTPKLWDIRRKLSVLEAKRLQGFPDNLIFPVCSAQAYKQLGNSVSVPIIKAISKQIINSYNL